MLDIKNKYIRKVCIYFLTVMARNDPDYFKSYVSRYIYNSLDQEIIYLRYINKLKFEAIPDSLKQYHSLRQVFAIHKKFIDEVLLHIPYNFI